MSSTERWAGEGKRMAEAIMWQSRTLRVLVGRLADGSILRPRV